MKIFFSKNIIIFPVLGLVIIASSLSADLRKKSVSPFALIESDYQQGLITLDEKLNLRLKLIFDPETLPEKYGVSDSGIRSISSRGVTPTLVEIYQNWDELSPETQQAFALASARPGMTDNYDSPGGFFKLHYDIAGTDSVSVEDVDINGIPDYIERIASYLDSSYDRHLELGYLLPPSDGTNGGDGKYDVYFEKTGFYGYAVPEGAGSESWNDVYSYIVLNRDFIGFPYNKDPEGQVSGAAKATAAHEYRHAVQWAYDIGQELWIMEGDATHMEDIVFDAVDDNYNYLYLFMDRPDKSLMELTDHYYSTFIWEMFLIEVFDTSLILAAWEGARYDSWRNTLTDTLSERYGWTVDSAFTEFVNWNFCTSSRNDNLHYLEAEDYNSASIYSSEFLYPVNLSSPFYNPAGYGASYIHFYPTGQPGVLTINFNGNDSRQWSAYLIKSFSINDHEFEKISLDPITYSGSVEVTNFNDYYRITLAGANIMEDSSAASFSYSASIEVQYSLSSFLVTSDTVVYSGGGRDYEFQITNTSDGYDILTVTAIDDKGWITLDSLVKSLGPGQDTVMKINVLPPAGTPLGEISNLEFIVRSWGDSTVTDTIKSTGLTVLQIGDINFSGNIDIADLTAMVNFLFKNGGAPQPVVLSADFDCSGDLNVADLTAIVSFFFKSGSGVSCNPY